MSDSYLVDTICALATRYSDVTWATGYLSPAGPYIIRDGQDMGWDNARTYFYDALTSTDPTVKEAKFVKSFRAVGMVMHLLQDMAVPAHVRNDMASHLLNSRNMKKWGSNPFEKYVVTHSDARNKAPVKPVYTAPVRLTDFWDTNFYNGIEPETTRYVGIGLAEYTNANFVSDFTLFKPQSDTKHYLKYPAKTSTQKVDVHIKDPFNWVNTLTRKYFLKTTDGDTGYLLAGVGYLDVKVGPFPYETIKTIPPMDDNVHAAYADRLLPRAVGYSAALLDYFFRGTLNVTYTPTEISFRSIKVTVANNTPGEAMGPGDVSLVVRHKLLTESGTGPLKVVNYGSNDYTYKVVTLPAKVDLNSPQELTFDLSAVALPDNFADLSIQLVYRGQLGNETDAVAVSEFKPIGSIYSDFALSLPPSGVYAKTADTSDTASFNELRVNAQANIPGGLTGGTIELALTYRKATTSPFQSVAVETTPLDGVSFIFRKEEKHGVSALPEGTPVELVFDLSFAPLPAFATDVHLSVLYKKAGSGEVTAIGFRDITEPTPVDIFNDTDQSCVSGQWYNSGNEALTAADLAGNHNGIFDEAALNPVTINTIYYKAGAPGTIDVNSINSNYTLTGSGLLPGQKLQLGYILTDYNFDYAIDDVASPSVNFTNQVFNGTGFEYQWDRGFDMMAIIRGYSLYYGAGVTYENKKYPLNSPACPSH